MRRLQPRLSPKKSFGVPEANSYLTYPEWHIVYAYEGLAKSLQKGDEHEFGYRQSIAGFWTSFCALNRKASSRGGADFPTRMTLHIIGQSFTFEMAMKAAYEETIGRFFAARRGAEKSAQDVYAAQVATDYAQFLQQKPWYQFDFEKSVDDLWNLPLEKLCPGMGEAAGAWGRMEGQGGLCPADCRIGGINRCRTGAYQNRGCRVGCNTAGNHG